MPYNPISFFLILWEGAGPEVSVQWPIFHDIPEAFTKSLSFTGGAEEWPPMVIRSPFFYSAFWVEALITSVAQNHVLLSCLVSTVGAGPRVNPR